MNFLETIISGIIGLWLGSMEYRMRKLREDVNSTATRKDIAELIDLKQEAVKSSQESLKEDIKEVKQKIDRLIELQLNK